MASTINARNTGSGGLISTADSSGTLQLQTNGVAGITIDSSQNITLGGPLVGNPSAPTAAVTDSDTTLATTAFVHSITDNIPNRNRIINGNFSVWEIGTSQSAAGYGSADQWPLGLIGSAATVSRQSFAIGQTAVPYEPKYYNRVVVNSVAGAGNVVYVYQPIESVRTLAGQSAVLTLWAKADATKNIVVEFSQNFGSGGSPSTSINGATNPALTNTVVLSTTWTKYAVPVTFPSITGKILGTSDNDSVIVGFWFDAGSTYAGRTNSLGQQSGTFDFAEVQLESGTVPTAFEHRTYGQELALCQRYYEKQSVLIGTVVNTYQGVWSVPKRVIPQLTLTVGTGTGATVNPMSITGWYQNTANSTQTVSVLVAAAQL